MLGQLTPEGPSGLAWGAGSAENEADLYEWEERGLAFYSKDVKNVSAKQIPWA